MIEAAELAQYMGYPINRLLTVRTTAMRNTGEGGIFRIGTQAECIKGFLEKSRHWMGYRGIPVANIWVREYSTHHGEHFHMAYHQQDEHDAEYAVQLAEWTEEPMNDDDGLDGRTVARSIYGAWDIQRCVKGDTTGTRIAAYLGKAEPSQIITGWGKIKINTSKPRRGHKGGTGPIKGNGKHAFRWGTSRSLGRTQRNRNRFQL